MKRYIVAKKTYSTHLKAFEAPSPEEALRAAKNDRTTIRGWAYHEVGENNEFEVVGEENFYASGDKLDNKL